MRSEDGYPFAFIGGTLRCEIDTAVYRLVAVRKAARNLASSATIHIDPVGPSRLALTFVFERPKTEDEARAVGKRFFEEALDQELREAIRTETEPTRMLMLAHALSRVASCKA